MQVSHLQHHFSGGPVVFRSGLASPCNWVSQWRQDLGIWSRKIYRKRPLLSRADGPVFELVRLHGFTPQTPGSTRVFLQLAWRGKAVAVDAAQWLTEVFHLMADRDAQVLETMQRCLDEDQTPRRYVNVKADRAAIRARRIVQSMIEEERGPLRLAPDGSAY